MSRIRRPGDFGPRRAQRAASAVAAVAADALHHQDVSQEIRRRLRAEFDATLPQFDLLAQLYREPEGLRLGELSRRTMVTNGNITGLADRLEADGLIQRETLDGDRRVTVARLTPQGRDASP